MGSHSVALDDEAWEIMKSRQKCLTPPENVGKRNKEASHSDIIKAMDKASRDTANRLNIEFNVIYLVLLLHYGNKDKAKALSERLRVICLGATKSDSVYETYTEGLEKILRGE